MSNPDGEDVTSGDASGAQVKKIGRKARRGLIWSLFGNLGMKSGTFAIGIVLARLLSPADFGVYAVALAVMAFAININDGGIIAACVQWRGKFEDMAPTGATIALLSSLFVYAALWFSAPAFAMFAGTPQATPVIRILTLVIVVDGISAMRTAALVRRFEQGRLTLANMVGMVANAGVAIPLGLAGAGAYSFAWGQLIGVIVTNILVFRMGGLPVILGFDKETATKLMSFGLPLAASLGVEAVLFNADYFIVGNMLGAVAVGYYLLAFNISSWAPGLVGTAVRYVAIPSFSRLAEQGNDALQSGVRRSASLVVATILPIAVAMAVLGPELIDVVYGEKWGPSGVVLQFLSIMMVVRMLTSLSMDVLISAGATRAAVWMNTGWAAVVIPALWVGTQLDGIRGTAVAHGIVAVFVALPLAVFALHRAGVSLAPSLRAVIRPVLGATISAAVTLLIKSLLDSSSIAQLLVAGGAGMATYVVVVIPPSRLRTIMARTFPPRAIQ